MRLIQFLAFYFCRSAAAAVAVFLCIIRRVPVSMSALCVSMRENRKKLVVHAL